MTPRAHARPPIAFPVNAEWRRTLTLCLHHPHYAPTPRGKHNRERLADLLTIDMMHPVLTIKKRNLGYRFLCAEPAWMLSGDNRVATIKEYSKSIAYFSDDGDTFFGAYGPKIVAQLPYVISALRRDRDCRQGVINIWRESPPATKDPPCTLNCQFLIRNDRLDLFVNMRSSDVWLGVPYDVFNFSMLAGFVILELGDPTLKPGVLFQYAGSRHLYEPEWEAAKDLLKYSDYPLFYPAPFDPATQFKSGTDLITHLWGLAERDEKKLRSSWLTELLTLKKETP
jgi:thymidylate synthase